MQVDIFETAVQYRCMSDIAYIHPCTPYVTLQVMNGMHNGEKSYLFHLMFIWSKTVIKVRIVLDLLRIVMFQLRI